MEAGTFFMLESLLLLAFFLVGGGKLALESSSWEAKDLLDRLNGGVAGSLTDLALAVRFIIGVFRGDLTSLKLLGPIFSYF